MVGTNEAFLAQAGLNFSDIRGVISLDTATYFLNRLLDDPASNIQQLAFRGNEALWDSVSPACHLEAGKPIPPFLLFYSEARPEAQTQAIPFVQKLKAIGVDAEAVEAKGKNHSELDAEIGLESDLTAQRVLRFLDRLTP